MPPAGLETWTRRRSLDSRRGNRKRKRRPDRMPGPFLVDALDAERAGARDAGHLPEVLEQRCRFRGGCGGSENDELGAAADLEDVANPGAASDVRRDPRDRIGRFAHRCHVQNRAVRGPSDLREPLDAYQRDESLEHPEAAELMDSSAHGGHARPHSARDPAEGSATVVLKGSQDLDVKGIETRPRSAPRPTPRSRGKRWRSPRSGSGFHGEPPFASDAEVGSESSTAAANPRPSRYSRKGG